MLELFADGVSDGMEKGRAYILEKTAYTIPEAPAEDTERELARFEAAYTAIIEETRILVTCAQSNGGGSQADILDAYLTLLEDPETTAEVRDLIRTSHNAVKAVDMGIGAIVSLFSGMEDEYMRERAYDIQDIRVRLIRQLLGIRQADAGNLLPGTVVVADNLATSDTARMNLENVVGFLTVQGGVNSHTSIVARSMGIPAVVGARGILEHISRDDLVLLDGCAGQVIINPDPETEADFMERREKLIDEGKKLRKFAGMAGTTKDGYPVAAYANIGLTGELHRAVDAGAEGIGLFRSEYLLLQGIRLTDEERQFEVYRSVVLAMEKKPVIIRTMDIGGDKNFPALMPEREDNPFLGYRAIRFHLDRADLLRIQLRAILRASYYGNVKIMFPMISCLQELRSAKAVLEEVKAELCDAGIPFDERIGAGIMIEIPAAAVMAEELAGECDFFSIGTNDLIQYTVAVDRGNSKVAHLYSNYHPAVLRLIAHTARSAAKAGIPCGMCGEAAGDSLLVPVWAGLGLTSLSTTPSQILQNRRILSETNMSEARELAEKVLACGTSDEVYKLLNP